MTTTQGAITQEPVDYPFGVYDRLNVSSERAGLGDGEPLVRVRLPYGDYMSGLLDQRREHPADDCSRR